LAASLSHLGAVYRLLGRYEEAITSLQASLKLCRELSDQHGQAEALRDLGDALHAVDRDDQARLAWQDALAICEALQIPETDEIRARLEVTSPP
jgi:tetratricopeptide (TPR) repeat protein